MQRTILLAGALFALFAMNPPSQAQQNAGFSPTTDSDLFANIPSDGNVTPEMWFYMQEYRRYSDPKEAVRRKAEMRGQQRFNRLTAMKWFGFSNSRPQASPVPQMGTYSPTWQGNSWNPYGWVGSGQTATYYVTRPSNSD
ncbi:MAG: hypothetical protein P8N76_12100 [Pirellulaceae bacterium]|nr:hypothetical protein [Pirellulaceae bacterium]